MPTPFSLSVSKLAVPVALTGSPRNLFTILGSVRVLSFYGYVSTAVDAVATSIKFVIAPTVGSTGDLSIATAVTSTALGAMIGWTGTAADALVIRQGWVPTLTYPIVFVPGTLGMSTTAGEATGAIDWYIEYQPLTPVARVSAA